MNNAFPDGDYLIHLPAMIERLWRSLKLDGVQLHELRDGFQAGRLIKDRVRVCNTGRSHAALDIDRSQMAA